MVNEVEGIYQLSCNSRHHGKSHVNYKGRNLGPCQKAAVARAEQNDPNYTENMVIRNMVNIADERVQIDHTLKDSVDRLVRAERDTVLSKNLGGVKVSGNRHNEAQKLRGFCEERRFDNAMKLHNKREKHIRAHTMLISSMRWQPEIHYGITTVNDIMNIWRAINAGEITFLYGRYIRTVHSVCARTKFV